MIQQQRLQRYRSSEARRKLFSETVIRPEDLILPIFVHEGLSEKKAISSMPGVFQYALDDVLSCVDEVVAAKIPAILLFGIPKEKDDDAMSSYQSDGVVQKVIKKIKKVYPELIIMADCCLCEYTRHGHCAVFTNEQWDNDLTCDILQKIAISYAESGVDIIAPSGMMDGAVAAIRAGLETSGHKDILLMDYAVKGASSFYGPFREAAGTSDNFTGDRKHHQLSMTQSKEAMTQLKQSIHQGSDAIIVKPAMPYLDLIKQSCDTVSVPIFGYQVSGEYAMIKAAAAAGIFDEYSAFLESIIAIKRAGATGIISYYAAVLAERLSHG